MAQRFVSGLPAVMPKALASPRRSLAEALRDAESAPREREQNRLRRRYTAPGTPETRRVTQRIVGERDA